MIFHSLDRSPAFKRLLTHVSSKSAFLHTSEWDIRTKHRPRVDGDLARLKLLTHAVSTVNVVGEDGSTEAMMGIIGFENNFLFRIKFGNTLSSLSA